MNINVYGLLYLIFWPLFGAIITQILQKKYKVMKNDWVDIVVIAEVFVAIILGINVLRGKILELSISDIFGGGLYLKMDNFRAVLSILTVVIWLFSTILSKDYFKSIKGEGKYQFFSLITLSATIGFILSNNLYCGFVFFEIMTLSSYPLVAMGKTNKDLKAGAAYLTIGIIGGLVTLVGIILLHYEIGSLRYDLLVKNISVYSSQEKLFVPAIFIGFGFFVKAGMFPVHTWLSDAYEAAYAPGSALLSAILSKTGVIGIIIVTCQIQMGYEKWGVLLLTLGSITMLLGAVLALNQINLKRIIAYSSMSQIGFIIVGLGIATLLNEGNQIALKGVFVHMINHSLFKILLFSIIAIISVNIGRVVTLDKIRGIGRKDIVLKFIFIISGLGLAGFPGISGYTSKTMMHEALVEYKEQVAVGGGILSFTQVEIFEILFIIAGGLTLAYMTKVYVVVFLEKGDFEGSEYSNNWLIKSVSKTTIATLFLSTMAVILLGIFPNIFVDYLGDSGLGFMNRISTTSKFSYFGLENLTGAGISILIGIVVYILFIRLIPSLIFKLKNINQDNNDKNMVNVRLWKCQQYNINIIPAWMNLQEKLYIPILCRALPTIGTFFARIVDWTIDAPAYWIRRTVLSDNKIIEEPKPRSKKLENLKNFSAMLSKSVSFGLMMFCLGFFATILYLLVLFFTK